MTKELLLHLFEYNKDRGVLIWKNPPKENSYLINQIAGTLQESNGVKYLRIGFKGKKIFVHKLIYFLEKNITPRIVDHIDGNGLNNHIKNLRASTFRKNSQNRIEHRKGALPGASWEKSRQKWFSSIQINGRTKFLGRFNTQKEAHARYNKAIIEFNL